MRLSEPISLLIEITVLSGLVIAWFLAFCPTRRSPFFAKATTDGVVRIPSAFAITVGSPPSITATHELVVPKSIPIILLILSSSELISYFYDCMPYYCFIFIYISLLEYFHYFIFAVLLIIYVHYRVMSCRVKYLALTFKFPDAKSF